MSNALEVKNLSKSFGKLKAVQDVSFDIPEGAVFGLIGRNGAGKTTTIRMIMDIFPKDSGSIYFRGRAVAQDFRDKVGYLPEERGLYKKMKIIDTILFFAELKGKKGPEVKQKAKEYLEKFDLWDRRNGKLEDLSKGNQQKVQFICTIIHDPEFIILDEPFSGLDPINTNILKDIILDLRDKGKVIIFSTHLMDFAEKMCDNIAIINHGKLLANGKLSDLKSEYNKLNVSLVYEGDISFLTNHPIVEKIENFGRSTGIRVKEKHHIQELFKLLAEHDVIIKKFDANDISLHEIFVNLTGGDEETTEMVEEATHA